MENGRKVIYEEAGREHRFLAGWRYGVIAGYLTISGVLHAELLKDDGEKNVWLALGGAIISVIFFLLHLRTTQLLWKSNVFLREVEKGNEHIIGKIKQESIQINGVYSFGRENIKAVIGETEMNDLFGKLGHTSTINWTILLSSIIFLYWLIMLSNGYNHACYHSCL